MLYRFFHNKTAVGTVAGADRGMYGDFAPWIAPHDPYAADILNKFAHFSREYPLGTDNLGRCILSRMIYGIRPTLGLAVLTMLGTIAWCFDGTSCRIFSWDYRGTNYESGGCNAFLSQSDHGICCCCASWN